jgi:hypothetical protein
MVFFDCGLRPDCCKIEMSGGAEKEPVGLESLLMLLLRVLMLLLLVVSAVVLVVALLLVGEEGENDDLQGGGVGVAAAIMGRVVVDCR